MTLGSPSPALVLGSILVLLTSSCSKEEETPPKPAAVQRSTEITSEMKAGAALDLVFSIDQQDLTADGTRVINVSGTHKGTAVGLIVALGPKWDAVAPETKTKFVFHTGTLEYRTTGEPSTALLAALEELSGTGLKPGAMNTSTKFAATSLQGDPTDLAKGEVRLKVEYEAARPEDAVEFYTDIDIPKHLFHIREKNAQQRAALVRSLAKN
ncbi:MAG: hypothetical protein IPJ19_16790 [Planctomycetes bacterium]|nr:hypothetical protein [Planctomycetota bacterium]